MIEAEYFTKRCLKEFGENLISVVLFGSSSRGNATKRSDLDFIIIVNRDFREEIIRNLRLDFLMKFGKKIDTICLTRKDAMANFEGISPLFATLVLGIKLLYDKGGFLKNSSRNLQRKLGKQK